MNDDSIILFVWITFFGALILSQLSGLSGDAFGEIGLLIIAIILYVMAVIIVFKSYWKITIERRKEGET